MSQLFPNYTRLPLEIAAGKGSYVTDTQGRRYLDFTSGIGVANLGYGPVSYTHLTLPTNSRV